MRRTARKTRTAGVAVALAAGLTAVVLAASAGPAAAIINGRTVSPAEYARQYQAVASLQLDAHGDPDWHTCGAWLVNPPGFDPASVPVTDDRRGVATKWAVTEAHCVTTVAGGVRPAESLHLRVQSADRKTGRRVGVDRVLVHSSWDWGTGTNPVADIAIVRLSEPVTVPARQLLRPASFVDRRQPVRVTGWGLTDITASGTEAVRNLQQADVRLAPAAQCAGAFISAGEICLAAQPGNVGVACYGDSGSPALQHGSGHLGTQWQVVGGGSRLTSESSATPCGGLAVYTDMAYYAGWIRTVTRTGHVPPPAPGEEPTPSATGTTTGTTNGATAKAGGAALHWSYVD